MKFKVPGVKRIFNKKKSGKYSKGIVDDGGVDTENPIEISVDDSEIQSLSPPANLSTIAQYACGQSDEHVPSLSDSQFSPPSPSPGLLETTNDQHFKNNFDVLLQMLADQNNALKKHQYESSDNPSNSEDTYGGQSSSANSISSSPSVQSNTNQCVPPNIKKDKGKGRLYPISQPDIQGTDGIYISFSLLSEFTNEMKRGLIQVLSQMFNLSKTRVSKWRYIVKEHLDQYLSRFDELRDVNNFVVEVIKPGFPSSSSSSSSTNMDEISKIDLDERIKLVERFSILPFMLSLLRFYFKNDVRQDGIETIDQYFDEINGMLGSVAYLFNEMVFHDIIYSVNSGDSICVPDSDGDEIMPTTKVFDKYSCPTNIITVLFSGIYDAEGNGELETLQSIFETTNSPHHQHRAHGSPQRHYAKAEKFENLFKMFKKGSLHMKLGLYKMRYSDYLDLDLEQRLVVPQDVLLDSSMESSDDKRKVGFYLAGRAYHSKSIELSSPLKKIRNGNCKGEQFDFLKAVKQDSMPSIIYSMLDRVDSKQQQLQQDMNLGSDIGIDVKAIFKSLETPTSLVSFPSIEGVAETSGSSGSRKQQILPPLHPSTQQPSAEIAERKITRSESTDDLFSMPNPQPPITLFNHIAFVLPASDLYCKH
ncbi:hypothetical protein H4219_006102 [Mycoemilia scoparia]|uniref:Uncharacterized protein n=1 Tax=Mycoemilia scoparia TaxID=417184 RepID=A0A9W8DIG5_9FUNG|nr:hypothetical protein H4219_006102 [Mycoemilia scoparia]